jgi:hypothetical protein
MWIDCQSFLVNIDHVDYITFDLTEEGFPQVCIYFANRVNPLVFYGEDLVKLKEFFAEKTVIQTGLERK